MELKRQMKSAKASKTSSGIFKLIPEYVSEDLDHQHRNSKITSYSSIRLVSRSVNRTGVLFPQFLNWSAAHNIDLLSASSYKTESITNDTTTES